MADYYFRVVQQAGREQVVRKLGHIKHGFWPMRVAATYLLIYMSRHPNKQREHLMLVCVKILAERSLIDSNSKAC